MFSKLALFALAAASVNALTLNPPTDARSATPLELSWNFDDRDVPFTLELSHPTFKNDFALANNVDPLSGGTRVVIPTVTTFDSQYAIRAVNISNINQEYARTPNFMISETASTSGGSTMTISTSSATNPPSGVTTTASNTNTVASNTNTDANSNSGTANTSTNTNTATTGTNTNTAANSGAPTNSPQNGGNGAMSAGVSVAAVIVGAVAAIGLI